MPPLLQSVLVPFLLILVDLREHPFDFRIASIFLAVR